MGNIFITPQWFFGYDVLLEALFAIIALLVAYYAWKIYKISEENHLRLFSWAFLFIGLSYVAQSVLNFLIMEKFDDDVSAMIKLQSVYHLNLFGIYLHSLLFIIGLLILAYISLRITSSKTFVLLVLLVFSSLYFSSYKTFTLGLVSCILLGFTSYYYLTNFWANRKTTTLLVLIAMLLLFVGSLSFLFATDIATYYVVGHILEFIAYLLVLINLMIILRVGRKLRVGRNYGKKAR